MALGGGLTTLVVCVPVLVTTVFSISSLALFAGETDDAKSNLNKIQKQINLIDKEIKN